MAELSVDDEYANIVLEIWDNHVPPRPAAVDGDIVWASSDETVLLALPNPGGLSGKIRSVAPGGPAKVSFTGDADLGAGVVPIIGITEDITVIPGVAGPAAIITVVLGAASAKA